MKKKVIYEASDGKGFESYLECEDYERELKKQHDNAVLSDAVNILIDLDKNFWANDRIYTTLEDTIEKCRYNPGIYLQAMIRDTFNKNDEISYSKLEIEIKNIFLNTNTAMKSLINILITIYLNQHKKKQKSVMISQQH